jgi:hypothetical protein
MSTPRIESHQGKRVRNAGMNPRARLTQGSIERRGRSPRPRDICGRGPVNIQRKSVASGRIPSALNALLVAISIRPENPGRIIERASPGVLTNR